jgi:hypothetical protein
MAGTKLITICKDEAAADAFIAQRKALPEGKNVQFDKILDPDLIVLDITKGTPPARLSKDRVLVYCEYPE